ncbi:MAG: hypothetical protein A2W90_09050 [Bacteroidetes bacterium GWF2_42_66]|nr:MAG: hypothetical protein A2W92_12025 [Bacteroidetes bacterium GWA2_42_15]OFY00558.1 MAG: hypothetical protein A2W89_20365 [Bacteroidetes bacterium GWE2_42_39]OFY42292.1 MAG: hypothetical protein A2W90_09050 [Bacteroidetes bacterium GWF2_42_66]HAZ02043.1 hypothetical protein [Marinilabiliales bacterium]HBL76442.1 hypothetical protein [Prolixibacteraceae bacterium]
MEDHYRQRRSGSTLAWILIIIGLVLILKNSGWGINIPGIGSVFTGIGHFIGDVFHFFVHIGWPVVLIIAGIILLAGRKLIGGLILFLLLLFILPKFILIPGILLIIFFPLILIVAGIVILTKLF